MRHLCIKDYYSVNYDVEVKRGYIYSAYNIGTSSMKVHYCHDSERRDYNYCIRMQQGKFNKIMVPIDEHSDEHLFELSLTYGVEIKDSLISFLDMINTPE